MAQHGRTTSAMPTTDPWKSQMEALGAFIRAQRKLADLSLRELAELTDVSNPYLSQLERGLHQPSVRVLKSIAKALNLSAETLLAQAGLLDDSGNGSGSSPQVGGRHPRRPRPVPVAEGSPDRRLPQHAAERVATAPPAFLLESPPEPALGRLCDAA